MRKHPIALWFLVGLVMLGAFPRLIDELKKSEHPPRTPRAGLLLVAQLDNTDIRFGQTVVLLVESGEQGAWGLVLNRVRTPRGRALPPGVSRWGGPVSRASRFALVRAKAAPEGAHRILDDLYWLEGPRAEGLPPEDALTFAGMAGWAPGQLEQELADDGWQVMDGSADAVFSEPESLWAESIAQNI